MQKTALRILTNIDVLLGTGIFPGHQAEALVEARKFVASMATPLQKEIDNGEQQETGSGAGSEASAGGVDAGGIPNQRRKGRRGKADNA